ncbi:MAG TPA: hypothetical protein VK054_07170 [Beutenbergiaceae bacterium]|nr:hypothetical protein [Beutenbergiaceae bacterium]
MDSTQICDCGHVMRMHTDAACRACPCNNFTATSGAQAAILAGIERKRLEVDAANHRRATWRDRR